MTPKLILASTSPFRQQLLNKLALDFDTMDPGVDESPQEGEAPLALVERLAREKALAVAKRCDVPALIIGSDQLAVCDDHILGKPLTAENAIAQLKQQRGKTVTFYTGLALVDNRNMSCQSVVEPFEVRFRQLSDEQIERYVELEQPLWCAGSFKSEGLGICLFESLSGRDPNTLVGLPLISLCELLMNAGMDPLA
ncbi:Maf family protein [Shewanella sedimentimangrovi]|uniref:7-methyl-GTP pyrophosphatase n=1 Tax=Shewanella sedimentimangrovi TaxID=2814293 RepID=A0ABX7R4D8_9GAMM|nr:nucleoside triphosphate pyrophosphatase [Shewanella sedimentimangrovi]QSX38699.1 septum formation inhibitor Maf [Shewanella sedimentimangrovi]